MTEIIVPISRESPFFPKEDYFFPKPLVNVLGEPLIIHVIQNIQKYIIPNKFIFIIPETLEIEYSLGEAIKLICQCPVDIILRKGNTSGGLCSTLLAIDNVSDDDIVISNMDDLIDYDLNNILYEFKKRNADAGLITFESSHPRWSYIKKGLGDKVLQNVEKRVVSKLAAAGFYFFKNKDLFVKSAFDALLDEDKVNGFFYISSAINQAILKGNQIIHKQIPSSKYHSLYSPESIKEYEDYTKSKAQNSDNESLNLVIPAAGEGSRFSKDGWLAPKPFIKIKGKYMIDLVIKNLKLSKSKTTLIFNEKHLNPEILNSFQDSEIIKLKKTTQGTACTVLAAKQKINCNAPLLIANSDQLVDFSCEEFVNDCFARNLDGSILVFKDQELNPKWSFIKTNNEGLVTEVAEKKPISNLATVGIYLFKTGKMYCEAAIDMILENDRVNDEFYTCPVYNYLIKNGAKIGYFEISQEHMNGIGTPNDLREYLKRNSLPISEHDPTEN